MRDRIKGVYEGALRTRVNWVDVSKYWYCFLMKMNGAGEKEEWKGPDHDDVKVYFGELMILPNTSVHMASVEHYFSQS